MAGLVVVSSRILLAAVFAVAGMAKLADREGTRRGMAAFGVPDRATAALALLVPISELAVAGLLLPAETAVYGASGALALLAIFSAAIGWNLAHGRTPDCHCFGQLHSAPASWKTLVRNGALAAVAVVALVGTLAEPDASAVAWIGGLESAELLALAVAVAASALLVIGAFAFLTLMRSYGKLLVRLDRLEATLAHAGFDLAADEPLSEIGLEPGTPAPVFPELDDLLSPELPVLLLFTSPNCGPCAALLPTVGEWQEEHAGVLTIAVASSESGEPEFDGAVVVDDDNRLYEAFEANGTPSAVLIASDGTIGSWVAAGSDAIERLVAQATAPPPEDEGLPVGTEAPLFELPALDGERVSLADLRGRDTVLLFWNPDCGFCRSMHPDLLAWEASANGDHPQLVVVSSGDAEATRAEGFQSTVVLDEEFSAGTAFQANGTPMGVLVDSQGRIASAVVAGADAVLALAGGDKD